MLHQQNQTASNLLKTFTKQANEGQLKHIAPKTIYRTMLMSEDTYTTPLFLLVMDRYGPDALKWTPETIRMELEDDFHVKIPKYTIDKIMAAIAIVTTNYFYKDVTRFIELCNVLAGDEFQPDEFEPADASEILFGITEAVLLWPPNDDPDDTEFSPEIQEYISQILNEEGILQPFDVLRLAFTQDRQVSVGEEYADDPEMYAAIYEAQQSKQNELKDILLENVKGLALQIQMLPIEQGKIDDVVKQLQSIIARAG